jgi:hypothetical protein
MRDPISARQARASAIVAGGGPASVRTRFAAWALRNAAHDVSILMAAVGAVGRYRGALPRSKVSMMSMRPPQQGQGYERPPKPDMKKPHGPGSAMNQWDASANACLSAS